ncbi:TlyA family RNA methyltransferase [Bacteriovorax sp. DB6_IX]|uniref:TlyA family RNA methyltransferase n=1 Tax=Bacteriovorax sp. DB6_IX TaxID=1353530 RepID=UPI00038A5294|nr:TlyA family RNA methyltransferase [Bacteriovorax sp. DB6_IX]EQC50908.1 ribosomal RNA large subunit methyltransferase J [Bacteriovorax sp. DB6_IX]
MADRLDKRLVDLGLIETRSQAQQLIKEGVVLVEGEVILKPSFKTQSEDIIIKKETLYVGRGAHKVEGALKRFNINPEKMVVADVGACTGGFTEYVLTRGATRVFAIDVGRDQLAKKLVEDERVINLEGTNIRDLWELEEPADLAVVDLSFISLKLVMENITSLLKADGKVVALVKPQFEVGKDNIGKKGLVKNNEIVKTTICDLLNWCSEKGFYIQDFCISPITGKTGNTEYFFYIDKAKNSHLIDEQRIMKVVDEGL